MALTFDLTKTNKKTDNAITDAIIFSTMSVGMNCITEDNINKFFMRMKMTDKVLGYPLYENSQPRYITFNELQEHIGLSTNAENLTDAKFNKKLINFLENDAKYSLRMETKLKG